MITELKAMDSPWQHVPRRVCNLSKQPALKNINLSRAFFFLLCLPLDFGGNILDDFTNSAFKTRSALLSIKDK